MWITMEISNNEYQDVLKHNVIKIWGEVIERPQSLSIEVF